jgi:hypothetical protein
MDEDIGVRQTNCVVVAMLKPASQRKRKNSRFAALPSGINKKEG